MLNMMTSPASKPKWIVLALTSVFVGNAPGITQSNFEQAQYSDPFLSPAYLPELETLLPDDDVYRLACLAGTASQLDIVHSFMLADPDVTWNGMREPGVASELEAVEAEIMDIYRQNYPSMLRYQYVGIIRTQNINRYADLFAIHSHGEESDNLFDSFTTGCNEERSTS